MIGLMWFRNVQKWFARIWKDLEMQAGKAPEFSEQSMMGDSGQSSEEHNADRNADSKNCAHKVSGENENCWELIKGHACYPWAKNVAIFFYVMIFCGTLDER